MKAFFDRSIKVPELSTVRCNYCGREVAKDKFGYLEDYVSIVKDWGYNSPYDGEVHTIDLCVDCYKDWTSNFAIPPEVEYVDYVWEA